MLWNNYTFLAELLGTLVLALGVSGTLLITRNKAFGLKGTAATIFTAGSIGLSLAFAVAVSALQIGNFKGNTFGFANPAVALMHALGHLNFTHVLPSLAGELAGAVLGTTIVYLIERFAIQPAVVEIEPKIQAKNSIIGEILGSTLFLGGVAIAVFYHEANSTIISGLIVGASIFIAISLFGQKFALLLNPAIAFVQYVAETIDSKGKNFEFNLANTSMKLVANLAIASAIGGIAYGLFLM